MNKEPDKYLYKLISYATEVYKAHYVEIAWPLGQVYYYPALNYKLGFEEEVWVNSAENIQHAYLHVVCFSPREAYQKKLIIVNYLRSNKEEFNFFTEKPKEGEYVWASDLFHYSLAREHIYNSKMFGSEPSFKNHILFRTAEEAIYATENIIQLLNRIAAKKRFKPLTKAPQDGTTVYLADVTSKDGYKSIVYTKEFEYLLNYRLLFSEIYGALQASIAMRQLIKP